MVSVSVIQMWHSKGGVVSVMSDCNARLINKMWPSKGSMASGSVPRVPGS